MGKRDERECRVVRVEYVCMKKIAMRRVGSPVSRHNDYLIPGKL